MESLWLAWSFLLLIFLPINKPNQQANRGTYSLLNRRE